MSAGARMENAMYGESIGADSFGGLGGPMSDHNGGRGPEQATFLKRALNDNRNVTTW